MIDIPSVRTLLDRFDPEGDRDAQRSRERTQALLDTVADPFDRTVYDPGHITASAVVLSTDLTAVLLVHHRRVGAWIQPGGHVEPRDATVIDAARREVREETGLALASHPAESLVRIDVHAIPPFRGEPHHWHHDLTFGFRATAGSTGTGDSTWRWWKLTELDEADTDSSLRRAVDRARALFDK